MRENWTAIKMKQPQPQRFILHKCSYLEIEGKLNTNDNSVIFFGKHFENIMSAIRLIKMLHFDYSLDAKEICPTDSFPEYVKKNIKYLYKLQS